MKKLLFAALVLILAGCKTQERIVTVEKVRTDTTYITKQLRDSIWLHDSIYMRDRGDTILIERWHTRYQERQVHDTLYQSRVDSIPVPYPVTEYVEKQLNWWQKTRIHCGEALLALLLAAAGFGIYKLKKRL